MLQNNRLNSHLDESPDPANLSLLFSANRAGKAAKPNLPSSASKNHQAGKPVSEIVTNQTQSAKNVTFLLDNLLKDYDNSLRPRIGGKVIALLVTLSSSSF